MKREEGEDAAAENIDIIWAFITDYTILYGVHGGGTQEWERPVAAVWKLSHIHLINFHETWIMLGAVVSSAFVVVVMQQPKPSRAYYRAGLLLRTHRRKSARIQSTEYLDTKLAIYQFTQNRTANKKYHVKSRRLAICNSPWIPSCGEGNTIQLNGHIRAMKLAYH